MKLNLSGLSKEDEEFEKEMAEKEKKLQDEELKRKQELEERIKQQKIARAKRLEAERIQMLKMKQGIIEEKPIEKKEVVVEKPKGTKAIENFWYHYKLYIILFSIFFAIAGFLLVNLLTNVKADVNIIVLPDKGFGSRLKTLEKYVAEFATDINKDGKTKVGTIHIPIESLEFSDSTYMVNQTKLMGEIKAGETMLFISNATCDKDLNPPELFKDLRTLYPDNPNVTEYGFKLEGEKIKEILNWPDMPDGYYIGIRDPEAITGISRKKAQQRYEESFKVLDGIIKDLS